MSTELFIIITLSLSLFLTLTGLVSLWQILTGWSDPKTIHKSKIPRTHKVPKTRFTIIVPARHEEEVIVDTLKQLTQQQYPREKYEVLIPMAQDDIGTIAEVERVIDRYNFTNVKPIIFSDGPINKPHGLNKALREAKGDYIGVIDAEDQVHTKLLGAIDTVVQDNGRSVIQVGVKLVNWYSNWFSVHAALEYYFWFKSRLAWFSNQKTITLAGTGVFIPRERLVETKGWDERCLTEDAKLGIEFTLRNIDFKVLTEEAFAIEEEAPQEINVFVKQRTRWIQGFLQIFSSKIWAKLPLSKKFHYVSFITFPVVQLGLLIWLGYSLVVVDKLPVSVVLISFIPLGLLIFQMSIYSAGLIEMLTARRQAKYIPLAFLIFGATYIPYQLLVNICAVRALYRLLIKEDSWEKTPHHNIHRKHLQFAPSGGGGPV